MKRKSFSMVKKIAVLSMAAEYGYRPSNESILKEFSDRFDLNVKLYTIKDYGGWNEAYKNYFDDGAMFDEIYGNE